MARMKLRSRREVVERFDALRVALSVGLERLGAGESDSAVVEAVWESEGMGTLLWALERLAMPPFDRSFALEELLAARVGDSPLRDRAEIEHARESARLWHWRARSAALRARGELPLPPGWQSFEQLTAVVALRGHERGLLPAPVRGDFPAFGASYRSLGPTELAEALSIAYERHRALNWLCGSGSSWVLTPTDT